jgi:hypothetical protein
VNITIPGNVPGGQYYVYIDAEYNTSTAILKGKSKYFPLIINNTGLWMVLISYPSTLANGTSGVVKVGIKNYGGLKALSAKIKLTPGGLLNSTTLSANSSCPSHSFSANAWAFDLSAFNSIGCWAAWRITAGQTRGTTTSTINGTASTWYRSLSFNTEITKPPEITAPPLPTYVADLEFIKAETLILIEQNSTNFTVVEVKNTGNMSLDVTFSIEGLNARWYSINTTKATIVPGEIVAFKVDFEVGIVEAKDYRARYKVANPEKTISKSFTLRVLLGEEAKKSINLTLRQFELNYTKFAENIEELKLLGLNVSLAEEAFSQLKNKIDEAKSLIAQGDYLAASKLFVAIQSLIEEVDREIKKIEVKILPEPEIDWKLVVLIVIGVIVTLFLAYLFWPVGPGYKPEHRIFVKERKMVPNKKLKNLLLKLKIPRPSKPPAKKSKKTLLEKEWEKVYKKYKEKK